MTPLNFNGPADTLPLTCVISAVRHCVMADRRKIGNCDLVSNAAPPGSRADHHTRSPQGRHTPPKG